MSDTDFSVTKSIAELPVFATRSEFYVFPVVQEGSWMTGMFKISVSYFHDRVNEDRPVEIDSTGRWQSLRQIDTFSESVRLGIRGHNREINELEQGAIAGFRRYVYIPGRPDTQQPREEYPYASWEESCEELVLPPETCSGINGRW
jgi:hypothetical protein